MVACARRSPDERAAAPLRGATAHHHASPRHRPSPARAQGGVRSHQTPSHFIALSHAPSRGTLHPCSALFVAVHAQVSGQSRITTMTRLDIRLLGAPEI